MHAVIGQFCRPYSTAPHTKFESSSRLRHYNYLTNLFLVRTVSYVSSFFSHWFMAHALRAWAISGQEKSWIVTYSVDLELDY